MDTYWLDVNCLDKVKLVPNPNQQQITCTLYSDKQQ